MKAKKRYLIILVFVYLLVLSACNKSSRIAVTEESISAKNDFYYTISTNKDLTYSYKITAKNGNILFFDDNSQREPHIDQVNTNIFSVTIQTGTGRSTNWAVFCDVENGKTSQTYQYVLGAQDNYVFYVEFEDSAHRLVVQDIFDSSIYQKTYTLPNCGAFTDPVCELTFESKGKAIVTYLTGNENAISQTGATIYFP